MGIDEKVVIDLLRKGRTDSAEALYSDLVYASLEKTRNERLRARDFVLYYQTLGYAQRFNELVQQAEKHINK